MRLSGCNHDPETVVLAHIRIAGHAGMGLKPADYKACFACSHCHDVIDGRVKGEFTEKDLLRGHFETMDVWAKSGLITVKGYDFKGNLNDEYEF